MRWFLTMIGWAGMIALMASTARGQLIIAHRGASHDAPENTLAAFRLAWEQQADGIEGDFYLTRDGRIVCIHDKTTGRTAGGVDLDVAASTLQELRKLDMGSWKDATYADERIATIEEVLAIVPPGKMFYIEIKSGPEILPALEQALSRSTVKPEQLRIICFDARVIAAAKERLPKIRTQWLSGYKQDKASGAWRPAKAAIVKTLKQARADGFNSNAKFEVFTPQLVKELKAMGLEIGAWTVDKPEDAKKLKQMGVDAITTNCPAFLREQLK